MIENITEVICCLLSFSLVFQHLEPAQQPRLNLANASRDTIEKLATSSRTVTLST
jgi:hypothetical protein